jgi:UDP-3-O-[3-hydroxymyristoyl] N-acetylglucosamine deacetylase
MSCSRVALEWRLRLSPYLQHTVASPAQLDGVGLHSGQTASISICPAKAGAGVVFVRTDVEGPASIVRARADGVCDTRLGTTIGNAHGVTVSTIEHLMAAFAGLGIDNAIIELNGPEVPIMDGSAEPFVHAVDAAGRRQQQARRRYIEVLEEIKVIEGGKSAGLTPAESYEICFEIDFDSGAIGRQQIDLAVDESTFRSDLSDSRTFGFLQEVDALRAAGLARGGSLDNVIVVDGDNVLNGGGLRSTDEFVRHKALDALGDLFLLGAPVIGRYHGVCSGHGLNNALARRLAATPHAWRWSSARQRLSRAG